MNKNDFHQTADLMLSIIPQVSEEKCFALKGGTAINFFWRNMPRFSVDIDLTYLPIEDREQSLKNISLSLKRIAESIEKKHKGAKVQRTKAKKGDRISKLIARSSDVQVVIDPNEVIRGSVFSSVEKELCPDAEKLFEKSVSITTLSLADIYGGKFCAALDRQHSRDIFDIKVLLENEGLTDAIRKAFIVYFCSHDRPMHELLNPKLQDISLTFDREFSGMTKIPVSLQELIDVRNTFIKLIQRSFTNEERKFLVSLKDGIPEWGLVGIPSFKELPAVRWKIENIQKLKS